MKTAYYTFTTWNHGTMAAGFGSSLSESRSAALVRVPEETDRVRGDNVIDLTAWRGASRDEFWEEPDLEHAGPDWAEEEPDLPASRSRRSRRAVFIAELISTLSVVAVAVALIVRVLTF